MSDSLVTVKTFEYPTEAEAAKMYLEAEGIQVYLADAEALNMDWLLSNALGYVKLQVSAAQAERASTLLENRHLVPSPLPKDDPSSDCIRCLSCDSLLPVGEFICSSCGWTYFDSGEDPQEHDRGDDRTRSDEEEETPNLMEMFRAIKKPIILVLIWPVILFSILVAITLLILFVHFLFE